MPQSLQRKPHAKWFWPHVALDAQILAGVLGCSSWSNSQGEGAAPRRSASPKKDWHAEEFRKMVALGESTTAGGSSTTPDRCWVSNLARLINQFQAKPMEFFNAGIGANVISSRSPSYEHSGKPAALERLDKHVIAQDPDRICQQTRLDAFFKGILDLFFPRRHFLTGPPVYQIYFFGTQTQGCSG